MKFDDFKAEGSEAAVKVCASFIWIKSSAMEICCGLHLLPSIYLLETRTWASFLSKLGCLLLTCSSTDRNLSIVGTCINYVIIVFNWASWILVWWCCTLPFQSLHNMCSSLDKLGAIANFWRQVAAHPVFFFTVISINVINKLICADWLNDWRF